MRANSQSEENYFVFVVDTVVGTLLEMIGGVVQLFVQALSPPRPRKPARRGQSRGYPGGSRVTVRQVIETRTLTIMDVDISRDPSFYQERRGLIPTRRLPAPRLDLGANPINSLPMSPPQPPPEVLLPYRRPASPDSGEIAPWPVQAT